MRTTRLPSPPPSRRMGRVNLTVYGGLCFEIQRELRSPNGLLGRHWREKHRERKHWQAALTNAVIDSLGVSEACQWLSAESGVPHARGCCRTRQQVVIDRLVPARRRFIRDDDNLRFACKSLLDALTHLGLIHDDSRAWIDLVEPTQDVSGDGTFWTVVTLKPIGADRAQ